jgi:hypothetical protein
MPLYSGQTLINMALASLGILEQGGTPSVSESNDALLKLNAMLGQWRIQELFVPSVGFAGYTLASNQRSYQIGPGAADFPVARPDWIERAVIGLAGPNPGSAIERDVRVTSDPAEYESVPDKAAAGAIPEFIYNDRGNPISTLYPWPVPRCATATNLILYTWNQILDFAATTTMADLADGYGEAIAHALTMRLAPAYPGVVEPENVQICSALAQQAEQNIRILNAKARGLQMPEQPQQQPQQRR